MDIPQVLAVLKPGQNWGPSANSDNTYAEFAAGWNLVHGTELPANPPPTQAAMDAQWSTIVANAAAVQVAAERAAAITVVTADTSAMARVVKGTNAVVHDLANVLIGDQLIGMGQLVWDPASVNAGAELASPNVPITMITVQPPVTAPTALSRDDVVDVLRPASIDTSAFCVWGYVVPGAPGVVVIKIRNGSAAAVNLASATWTVAVRRPRIRAMFSDADYAAQLQARINAG